MRVNVNITLNIEAPDSTGFSMDVMNLMDQILREMLDMGSPKRDQLHAIFDESEPADMTGFFIDEDYPESSGGYKVSLREPSSASMTLVEVHSPRFKVGSRVACRDRLTKELYFTGIVKESHYSFTIGEDDKGFRSRSVAPNYFYTVEEADGTLQTAHQHELTMAMEA